MKRIRNAMTGDEVAALAGVLPSAASLTVYMCWHGGKGHGYPQNAVEAAERLRERHMPQAGSNDDYTALTFPVSDEDVRDFEAVLPFCDLAYATDASGDLLAEASWGEASCGQRR